MAKALLILGVAVSLACTDRSPTGPNVSAALKSAAGKRSFMNRPPRRAPRVVGPRIPLGPPVLENSWDPTTHRSGVGHEGIHSVTLDPKQSNESALARLFVDAHP
jgi:hypothetical protein